MASLLVLTQSFQAAEPVRICCVHHNLHLLQNLADLCRAHGCPQKLFQGGKVDISLIFFRLLSMQCKWTYTKKVQCHGNSCIHGFPCKKLYTEQMFVLVNMDVLRLS